MKTLADCQLQSLLCNFHITFTENKTAHYIFNVLHTMKHRGLKCNHLDSSSYYLHYQHTFIHVECNTAGNVPSAHPQHEISQTFCHSFTNQQLQVLQQITAPAHSSSCSWTRRTVQLHTVLLWLTTSISISCIWKRRIMVPIRPRIRRGLPSTISCAPILSSRT
jgi:hypothetical protein